MKKQNGRRMEMSINLKAIRISWVVTARSAALCGGVGYEWVANRSFNWIAFNYQWIPS